jgi:hypothetical protein
VNYETKVGSGKCTIPTKGHEGTRKDMKGYERIGKEKKRSPVYGVPT